MSQHPYKIMPTSTYKCIRCESGPCYCITPDCHSKDAFGASSCGNPPRCCPIYGEEAEPNWRLNVSPSQRCTSTKWLVEDLISYVDDHYDEVPVWLQDAAYGQLIKPARRSHMKELDILHLMADDERRYIDDYDTMDQVEAAIKKATKVEIINDIIPAAFSAGMIFAYIRLKSNEFNDIEDFGEV